MAIQADQLSLMAKKTQEVLFSGNLAEAGRFLTYQAAWLKQHGVTTVAMEATGVFWKPVWAILEEDFELLLVNARHVKQAPGGKTLVCDAAWPRQLAEAGLLRASFA